MSPMTDNFNFELPGRGQYPGTWDIPINNNFIAIDTALAILKKNNMAATADILAPVGSTWYSSINNLLFFKTPTGMQRTSTHTHDGIDTPKIDLSNGNQVSGKLPGSMVDALTLNAGTVGGLTKDQIFSVPGDGLISSGSKVSLQTVLTLPGTFTTITLDKFGRAIAATNKGMALSPISNIAEVAPLSYDHLVIQDLITKLNAALAALRAHGILQE